MRAHRSYLFSTPARSPTTSLASTKQKSGEKRYADSEITSRTTAAPSYAAPNILSSPKETVAMSKLASSDPVVIPARRSRESPRDNLRHGERKDRRHNGGKSSRSSSTRPKDHSPDAIPPAVAALLATTAIPPPRSKNGSMRKSSQSQQLTVDAVLKHNQVLEKDFSLSIGQSPLDLLLTPPEELEDDDLLDSGSASPSYLSKRTTSAESVPSLEDGSIGSSPLSPGYPATPSSRGKRSLPTRKLEPYSLPGEECMDHPLSKPEFDVENLDFRVFERSAKQGNPSQVTSPPRQRSAFKSNLTASLRALKSAAKSLSSMTTPMITPDDFLTRSIIAIDPRVPFTDERMPPHLEDVPTPALRRYLNPTSNAPIDAHIPGAASQTTGTKCTASIQMQTYKISKSTKTSITSVISKRTSTSSEEVIAQLADGPVGRQRDMRENSDFIRIAVMEMMMRKNGKLDESVPGRARWALPPRQPSTKAYEIGEDGVPVRWIAITAG
jgi:hypothetical protein